MTDGAHLVRMRLARSEGSRCANGPLSDDDVGSGANDKLRELYGEVMGDGARKSSHYESGDLIGEFLLEEVLGSGGVGVVWRAYDTGLDRLVAVKLLLAGEHATPRARERFRREAVAGAKLDHPNVVRTLAIGSEGEQSFIVQELVAGARSLAVVLNEAWSRMGPSSEYFALVARLLSGAANGLAHAHENGVIHRDVKPDNILIDDGGAPRVADFGIAKLEGELTLSRTGEYLGTPHYMSPEQASGGGSVSDHRTDVFSFGVVLYEALTRVRPFDGTTTGEVMDRVRTHDPVDPSRLRPQLPRRLSSLTRRCLRHSPKRRPSDLAGVAELLMQGFGSHEAFLALEPQALMKVTRRLAPTGVIALALILGAALGAWLAVVVLRSMD